MKKKIIVHTAEKAIKDYNKKLQSFSEIQQKIRPPMQKLDQPIQLTLDAYLRQQGQPSTFSIKAALAKQMGMAHYTGSPDQDNSLLMSVQGRDVNNSNRQALAKDDENREKELGIKDKEIGLKKQEMKSQKEQNKPQPAPTASQIAEEIINKLK
jgi:predicted NodU family carbamoyl transferase